MNPTAEAQALLDALEGLHAPPPISWWPLAWGWWVLGLIAVLGLWFAVRWVRARQARRQWRALALARLRAIEHGTANATDATASQLADLSVLLRQIALVQLPHTDIARLHGTSWLEQLDRMSGTNQFSAGPGRLLLDAPYRDQPVDRRELDAVFALTRQLLKRVGDPAVPAGVGRAEALRD